METKAGDLEGLAKTSAEVLKSEGRSSTTQASHVLQVEDAPDPDEDDLDDLDGRHCPACPNFSSN